MIGRFFGILRMHHVCPICKRTMLLGARMLRRGAPLLMTSAALGLKVIVWGIKKWLFLIVWMIGMDEDAVSPCIRPAVVTMPVRTAKGDIWVSLMYLRTAN